MKKLQLTIMLIVICAAAVVLAMTFIYRDNFQLFALPFLKHQTSHEISHHALSNQMNSRKIRALQQAYSEETQTIRHRLQSASRKRIEKIISARCLPNCNSTKPSTMDRVIFKQFDIVFVRLMRNIGFFLAVQIIVLVVFVFFQFKKQSPFQFNLFILNLIPLISLGSAAAIDPLWMYWLIYHYLSLLALVLYCCGFMYYLTKVKN